MATVEAIASRFPTAAASHVVPTPEMRAASLDLRERVVALAIAIDDSQEDSRWKSLALTSLEETLLWANKGLFNKEIR